VSGPSAEHIDAVARLHAEHVAEFPWMAGDDLTDPVTAEECGNCQRWGRYVEAILSDHAAMLDALTRAGVLREETSPGILVLDGFQPGDGPGRRFVTKWERRP
jgi:hypothetical protein